MKKSLPLFVGAILIASLSFFFPACKEEDDDPAVKVIPPSELAYGKSYTEWSIEWMKSFTSFDCDNNPWLSSDKALFYQTGSVYFLAGLNTEGASVNISVPEGKAILFPLTNYVNDYPCPDPTFAPAPGQSLKDFLTEGIISFKNGVSGLAVEVDGASISDPASYWFMTDLFEFTGNPDLATGCQFDVCITGTPQSAVAGGYYMILKPLSRGTHTVHYHSVTWGNFVQDGTFNITVQ
jgi:hypothetical protein